MGSRQTKNGVGQKVSEDGLWSMSASDCCPRLRIKLSKGATYCEPGATLIQSLFGFHSICETGRAPNVRLDHFVAQSLTKVQICERRGGLFGAMGVLG